MFVYYKVTENLLRERCVTKIQRQAIKADISVVTKNSFVLIVSSTLLRKYFKEYSKIKPVIYIQIVGIDVRLASD